MILPCRVDADYRHWVLDLRSLQPLVRVGLAAAEPRLFLSPPPFLPLLPRAVWVPLFLLPPLGFLGRLPFLPPPVLGPSFFSLPPPGGSLPPPGGLDRLRAFSLPFLKTTHPPCVSLSLEPSVLSFFSKHKHHHLSSKLIFRTNMTSPHQFSAEGAVRTPISQCEDRSQAYLWVIRLDLPLWPSLFAFFVPIFHVFHSSLSAAVFARLFCLLLFQAL